MIKFEKVSRLKDNLDLKLPERATMNSAGYDFCSPEHVILPPHQLTRIMTGIKCELMPDMCLILANRSSNPKKKGLVLANGIGVVDADYYNNPDNEGEIGFEFYNILDTEVEIKQGEKLGQGIIMKFSKTEDDYMSYPYNTRTGGFGSTGN